MTSKPSDDQLCNAEQIEIKQSIATAIKAVHVLLAITRRIVCLFICLFSFQDCFPNLTEGVPVEVHTLLRPGKPEPPTPTNPPTHKETHRHLLTNYLPAFGHSYDTVLAFVPVSACSDLILWFMLVFCSY